MTPKKLDMAHWLLGESNGQADISADKRPNKKGGRNRPEKDMQHGPCAVRKRQCGPGAMVLATLKAAAAGAWPQGREAEAEQDVPPQRRRFVNPAGHPEQISGPQP